MTLTQLQNLRRNLNYIYTAKSKIEDVWAYNNKELNDKVDKLIVMMDEIECDFHEIILKEELQITNKLVHLNNEKHR